MAKNTDDKTRPKRRTEVQRITTVDNPNSRSPILFISIIGLIFAAGIAAIVFFAANRESNIDVAPVAGMDHWHDAYLIHNCGVDVPATGQFESADGLHTHGDGLLHLHPFNPTASGNNATLGAYMAANGAELTDDTFTSGITDPFPVAMSEAAGCDGEPAVLQLAHWPDAFDETAEPEIITENLADFQFTAGGAAITLALLPEGAEIPRPPADRLAALAQSGGGSPVETTPTTDHGGDAETSTDDS